MLDKDILTVLKTDLQISATAYDNYLSNLIELSRSAICREGIILEDTIEDGMLVEMYAAYLYRKRREETVAMPRSLRYALNNRLFSQKGSAE
ncbi:MAG: hypothetical protein E7397_04555 [Ruminococcaceae bacterium]|nr:hypothetical protein [Oscillospiraceae bacterium]